MDDKINKITDSISRDILTTLPVDMSRGGAQIVNYNQMLDLAKTMSTARFGVPAHLRGNPGDCLAIWDIATGIGLSPYMMAQHCYVVNDILCYDAQVIGAIVAKHAPLQERIRYDYEGEGDSLRCTVRGLFKNEADYCTYRSPRLGDITPKNSPLWKSDPEQQLAYFSLRRWARRYCPDILMGVYTRDEIEDGPAYAKDVTPPPTPNLMERLPGRIEGDGFKPDAVELQREEQAAVAVVQAEKKARRGRPPGSRNKKATPQPEATEKPVEATEAQEAIPQPSEPEPAPADTAVTMAAQPAPEEPRLPVDEPPYRGPPRNQGEYIAYAERMIRGLGAGNVERWYTGTKETILRAQCNVNDLTFKMLGTLVQEKAHGESH